MHSEVHRLFKVLDEGAAYPECQDNASRFALGTGILVPVCLAPVCQCHSFTRLGVASQSSLSLDHIERTKAGQFDVVTTNEAVFHGIDNTFHQPLGFLVGHSIVSTNSGAADALGAGDLFGSVKSGRLADLIVVDGDPIQDIKVLADQDRIKKVFSNGVLVKERA